MAEKQFPLSVVIRAIDRITTPMGKIQRGVLAFDERLRGRLSALGTRFTAFGARVSDRLGLPVMTAAVGRLGGALGDLGRRASIVAAGISAAVGAVALGAWRMIESFGTAGDSLADVTKQIGVGAEALQEWRYAAKQNGVEIEALDKGMALLARNFGDALAGKGEAKDVLAALGLDVKQFKNLEQLVPAVADKIAKIQNPMVRASVAGKLFGRSGVQLIPMLQDGSKGLSEYAAAARRLGIVISQEAVDQADEFGDRLEDLKLSFTGVRNIIGTQLLPVMTDLIKQMIEWVVDHGPRIQAWAKDFAAKLPDRLRALRDGFDQVREKLRPVIEFGEELVDKYGGANVTIAAVAAVLTLYLVPALAATASALYAVGVAILGTPIGWIAAAIVGVALLVYKYWTPLSAWFSGFWSTFSDLAGEALTGLGAALAPLKPAWDAVVAAAKAVWSVLEPVMARLFGVSDGIEQAGRSGQAWGAVLGTVFGVVARAIALPIVLLTKLGVAIGETAGWIVVQFGKAFDWLGAAWDGVTGAARKAWEGIKGFFTDGIAFVLGKVADIGRAAASIVPDWVRRMFGGGDVNVTATTTTGAAPVAAPAALGARTTAAPVGAAQVGRTAAQAATQSAEARVRVDFANVPRGTRIQSETRGATDFELNQGYAMGAGW